MLSETEIAVDVERWEPPAGRDPTGQDARVEQRRARRDDTWPEAVEVAAGRIVFGFFLIIAGTGRGPALWLIAGGPVLVLALFTLGTLVSRWGQPNSRSIWVIDAATFGLLTPLIVVSTFAAVGDGPLRGAEQSIYLQTILAALVVIVGISVFASTRLERSLMTVGLLPMALLAPTISLAHDDFRVASVTAVLSYVWLTSALITIAVRLVRPTVARILPIGCFTLYVLLLLALDPALATLGSRPAPIRTIHPLLILLPGVALVLPELLNRAPRPRSASRPRGRPRRRPHGISPDSEMRGPQ